MCKAVHSGMSALIFLPDCQTAYTKEHPNRPSTWLCLNCCYALNIDPFAKPKKAAKKAVARKEDRAKIVHYEERKGVTQLGDLCIQVGSLEVLR